MLIGKQNKEGMNCFIFFIPFSLPEQKVKLQMFLTDYAGILTYVVSESAILALKLLKSVGSTLQTLVNLVIGSISCIVGQRLHTRGYIWEWHVKASFSLPCMMFMNVS